MQVLGGEDTLGNIQQNSNTLIEYAGDYNKQVGFNETSKKDVFTFENVDSTITAMDKNSFSFSDDVTSQMKKGTFLYFDMFIPSCSTNTLACRIDVQLAGSYGPQIMYNNASKNTVDDAYRIRGILRNIVRDFRRFATVGARDIKRKIRFGRFPFDFYQYFIAVKFCAYGLDGGIFI